MQRMNYKAISGVIVDRCLRHGVWLDGGELRQIFEWKKAGGEVKTKETSLKPVEVERGSLYTPKESYSSYFDPIGDFFNWLQGG
jgi:Zn-finger nucleic acid-binding protein